MIVELGKGVIADLAPDRSLRFLAGGHMFAVNAVDRRDVLDERHRTDV